MIEVEECVRMIYSFRGHAEGVVEGHVKGHAEGQHKERLLVAKRMFKKGMSLKEIQELTGLSFERLNALLKETLETLEEEKET